MTRWQEFEDVVERSSLPPKVAGRALSIFRRLAEAEATAHRTAPEETHLHELGELDTLVDVVGSVVGLELLGIERLYASAFPTGSGVVRSAHGVLPVPSPATAALLASANAPVVKPLSSQAETGEMVTPTGAAILTTLASFHHPSMSVERVGYGLGTRESPDYPNVLALWLGRQSDSELATGVSLIETNVDDSTAEVLGYVQERLFEAGALDVWFTPIQMKKNRPGTMMSAIVPGDLEAEAVDVVMSETSTLGVRVRPLTRYEAAREIVEVDTSLGPVEVKVKRLGGECVAVAPEYESCRRIAVERGMALQQVYRTVAREAEVIILGG